MKAGFGLRTRRNCSPLDRLVRSFALMAAGILLSGVAIKPSYAHIIDRTEINQEGNEAEILIQFDVQVQYLRDASFSNGEIHIFFSQLEADPSGTRMVPEAIDSPPSDISPHFTLNYPGLDGSLVIKFDDAVSYRVRPGKDGRSISVFVPATNPEEESEPTSAVLAPKEVEKEAKQLITSVRDSLAQDQFDAAIEKLNLLLNLPPNTYTQTAQKLIGEAREKNGELAKARVEYQLYLKLYPDAKDARQVRERVARLPEKAQARTVPQFVPRKKRAEEVMTVFGSFSQSYYKGMSHIDATTANGLSVTTETLDNTDQSTLLSSLDLTGRKRTETTDTRIVFRDDYKANFLPRSKNDNRLTAFYVEQSTRDHSYLYRLGRQRGGAGGVSGRFDGAWLSYSPVPAWHINGVLGTPAEPVASGFDRKKFSGVSVDLTRLPEQWSGSIYYLEQRAGTVVDRKATGLEAHYFDTQSNYMGLVDYDNLFKMYNIAMFQGNWTTDKGDNYLMLADHRKTPPLQLSNSIPGQTMQSMTALVESGVKMEDLIRDAKTLTATSNLFMVGMTHPYSKRLRLGGDFRVTNISDTGAVGCAVPGSCVVPAASGTGNIYMITAQAIGNDLLFKNDLGVASASYIKARTYKGESLTFSQVETFKQSWRMDFSLQLYNQTDNMDVHQVRITPSLKLSYSANQSVSFDIEGGLENTHSTSATRDEKVRRKYFYLGYRWDFH